MTDPIEPCGVWVTTRFTDGERAETRWCGRITGPCPFPGADIPEDSDRLCGASPTKRLRVRWAESCVERARADLVGHLDERRDDGLQVRTLNQESIEVAIAAIDSCSTEARA